MNSLSTLLSQSPIALVALTASIVGLTLTMLNKQGRASAIPFGPYLALGAMMVLLNTSTLT